MIKFLLWFAEVAYPDGVLLFSAVRSIAGMHGLHDEASYPRVTQNPWWTAPLMQATNATLGAIAGMTTMTG